MVAMAAGRYVTVVAGHIKTFDNGCLFEEKIILLRSQKSWSCSSTDRIEVS